MSGYLFQPGCTVKTLECADSGQVFLADGDGHGHWSTFENNLKQKTLLIAYSDTHLDSTLVPRLFFEHSSGLWSDATLHLWIIFPEQLLEDDLQAQAKSIVRPAHTIPLEFFNYEKEWQSQVKHRFLWLHPGREPGFLYIMNTNKVMWSSLSGNTQTPYPSGHAMYIEGDIDGWYIKFHWTGNDRQAKATIFGRALLDCELPVWRACGTPADNWTIDDLIAILLGGQVKQCRHFHILMLPLKTYNVQCII